MVQKQMLDTLQERLSMHSQIFDDLLQLIPRKHYLSEKKDFEVTSKYAHNKRKKAPKQEIKEATKKAKKAKFDPENQVSVSDVYQALAKQKEDEKKEADNDDAAPSETPADKMEVDTHTSFEGLGDSTPSNPSDVSQRENVEPMQRSDISELRARVRQRIEESRQKRNAPGTNSAKDRTREDILAERQKKKEDRKKALKARKEKGNQAAPEEMIIDKRIKTTQNGQSSKSAVNMDGDVFFGKLDVGGEKKKKSAMDAKTQLKKLEEKEDQLQQLIAKDEEGGKAIKEKEQWKKALAMASGEKVKDDIKLLKKTVKRKDQQKTKSAKEWNERLDKVKQDEQAKIKKRQDNLQKRIDAKKDKKAGKKTGKKVKARPGFEGGKNSKGGKVTKKTKGKAKGNKK